SGTAYVADCYVRNNGVTYVSKSAHTSSATNAPGTGAQSSTYWTTYSVFNVTDILDNFGTQYPQWAAQGFEIAGFGWFQGWNDGQSTTTGLAIRYEQNLVRLIKQLRLYYQGRYPGKIKTDAPFVVATCGFDGWAAAGNRLTLANAQLAVGNPALYPEFAGNVKSMEARGYWRTSGPNTAQNYHYYHNAETYMLVGDAMGRGMLDLLGRDDFTTWASKWPGANLSTPGADADGDGMSNEAERLFGLDPTRGSSCRPVAASITLNTIGDFTYTRRTRTLTNSTYAIWTSTDLNTWIQDTGATQTVTSTANEVEVVSVGLNVTLLTGDKRFVQVRAATP
ncbi:MAG: hypothetical protein RLZZ214_3870, partial [Verrucomicrobiota bacterium]